MSSIARTFFYALAVVVTVGLIPRFRDYFCKNGHKIIVYAGSIPVSIAGIISPQTINKKILNLTPYKCKKDVESTTLTYAVKCIGTICMRQRIPIK